MAGDWNTIRVFVSSTFKDMQAERDHLVRFVFPRLREALLPRRMHLVDIDLRWGVTRDQDAFELCMDEIDRCHPRFICLLGGRYGWIPPDAPRSITASEIHYAVLDRLDEPAFRFFYFRDPAVTEAIPPSYADDYREPAGSPSAVALEALKNQVKTSTAAVLVSPDRVESALLPIREYPCAWDQTAARITQLETLGQQVYLDLLASIDAEYGQAPPGPINEFAEENAAMAAFVETRVERYVVGSRQPVLDALYRHTESGSGTFCIVGEAGSGKSSLLAKFYRDYVEGSERRGPHTGEIVIPHFVGATAASGDVRLMLRRLCRELVVGARLSAPVPEEYSALRAAFATFLERAAAVEPVVILIDAVDRLESTAPGSAVHWLPDPLPTNARVALAVSPGSVLDALRARRQPPTEISLGTLDSADATAIVDEFLACYRKTLDDRQRRALLEKPDAGSPLYLVTALEELRTLGTYDELTERIRTLPGQLQPLFAWILERLERDPGFVDESGRLVGAPLLRRWCSYLAISRWGLSQAELAALVFPGDPHCGAADPRGHLAALQRLLRPYLVQRGELVDFSNGQLRQAVAHRYIGANPDALEGYRELRDLHRDIATCLETLWPDGDRHALRELPYHLLAAEDYQGLVRLLRGAFLDMKSSTLGSGAALTDAKEMVEALASTGDRHWDDLILGAGKYCDLAERLRKAPRSFESMIDCGDVSGVLAALEAETDPKWRPRIMVAVSTLLADEGYADEAADIRGRVGPLQTDYGIDHLVKALGEPGANDPADGEMPSIGAADGNLAAVAPRRRVPILPTLLVYLGSGRLLAGAWIGLAFSGFALGVILWIVNSEPLFPDKPLLERHPSLYVGLALYGAWLAAWVLIWTRRYPTRFDEALNALLEAAAGLSRPERDKVLTRAIRYQSFLSNIAHEEPRRDPQYHSLVMVRLSRAIVDRLRECRDSAEAAGLILEVSAMGPEILTALIAELRTGDGGERDRICKELVSRRSRSASEWQVFNTVLATVSRDCDPAAVVSVMIGPPDPPDGERAVMQARRIAALRKAPPVLLARIILAHREDESADWRRDFTWRDMLLRWRSFAGPMGWAKTPIGWAEPFLALLALGPTYVGFSLGFIAIAPLMLGTMAAIGLVPIMAARKQDPFRLSVVPFEGDLTAWRRALAAKLRLDEASTAPLLRHRIVSTLVAQWILRGEPGDFGTSTYTAELASKVLSRLRRRGFLKRRADVLVRVMGERSLLEAVAMLDTDRDMRSPEEAPEEPDHLRQLRRVLPLAPPWKSVGLTFGVAALLEGLWLWLLVRFLTSPAPAHLLTYGAATCVVMSCLLATVQHVALQKGYVTEKPGSLFYYVFSGWLSLVGIALIGAAALHLARRAGVVVSPEIIWTLAVGSLLLTNFVTPELIARWRGAALCYPAARELFAQRVISLLVSVAACVVMAVLAGWWLGR